MRARHRSSIPRDAEERTVGEYRAVGGAIYLEVRRYFVSGELVGERAFWRDGTLASERPMRGGRLHGVCYEWDESGALELKEPYREGLIHGTASQFAPDGTLLGTYTMRQGTGFDVWRCRNRAGRIVVSEIHGMKSGKKHGFTWWLRGGRTPHHEEHFWDGAKHGIERVWNDKGRLRRGYPKYWVSDELVSKREYSRACTATVGLPPFREIDQSPRRRFPPAVRALLREDRSSAAG